MVIYQMYDLHYSQLKKDYIQQEIPQPTYSYLGTQPPLTH